MQFVTLGNETPRAVELHFEFSAGRYCLKLPAHGETELQLPPEGLGALLDQNQHLDLRYVAAGQRATAGLWFTLGGGL
ncbi:hypothetical+protein [Methylocapsa aurea]|uniref:hypothetical protein n=1 Tax=Methylocapsa aurea TaxID=663610 RepID=UPI003D18E883